MDSPACLYVLILAPHERIEPLLLDEIAPIVREILGRPELDSWFFVVSPSQAGSCGSDTGRPD
jgi:hypothetical protein